MIDPATKEDAGHTPTQSEDKLSREHWTSFDGPIYVTVAKDGQIGTIHRVLENKVEVKLFDYSGSTNRKPESYIQSFDKDEIKFYSEGYTEGTKKAMKYEKVWVEDYRNRIVGIKQEKEVTPEQLNRVEDVAPVTSPPPTTDAKEPKQQINVPTGKQAEKAANAFESITQFKKKMATFDFTAAEVKEWYKYAIEHEAEIKEGVILEMNSRDDYKRKRQSTKDEIAENTFKQFLSRLTQADGGLVSYYYDLSSAENNKRIEREAMNKKIEGMTEESVSAYLGELKRKREGLKNPVTLEDYQRKKTYMELSPEENDRYEDLLALESKKMESGQKASKNEAVLSAANPILEGTGFDIRQDTHTKTGAKIWLVNLKGRVDDESYRRIAQYFKSIGGYWSRYSGAFLFDADPSAKIGAVAQSKPKNYADRLRELADGMQEEINEKQAPRLQNTARRAAHAESMENQARYLMHVQETLRNIAAAQDRGEVQLLTGIQNKTQVELLESALVRANRKNGAEKESITAEDTRFAEMPLEKARVEHLYELVKDARESGVGKRTTARIEKYLESYMKTDIKITNELLQTIQLTAREAEMWASRENAELKVELTARRKKGEYYVTNRELLDFLGKVGRYADTKELDRQLSQAGVITQDDWIEVKPIREEVIEAAEASSKYSSWWLKSEAQNFKRCKAMGITTPEEFRAYLREYLKVRAGQKEITKEEKIRAKQRELIGRKIAGYFPTPRPVVDRMLELANISQGDKVLEPSAGQGAIADAVGIGKVDVAEINTSNREILELKGHRIIGQDALSVKEQYDKVLMNPPFEAGQDADHVRYAFENNLKEGGTLVAIVSEGLFFRQDKKATEFRQWFDAQGGTSEKLPEGSFLPSAEEIRPGTGVSTRIIAVHK